MSCQTLYIYRNSNSGQPIDLIENTQQEHHQCIREFVITVAARFRSCAQLPLGKWYDPGNGYVFTRSAQENKGSSWL